jgi:hypothetical protein
MNWGWRRIKATVPGFAEYSRKVQNNGFNVGPWKMKSIRRHGYLDLSMERFKTSLILALSYDIFAQHL